MPIPLYLQTAGIGRCIDMLGSNANWLAVVLFGNPTLFFKWDFTTFKTVVTY